MLRLKTYTRAALALLLGERCVVCGRPHVGAQICNACLLRLPYINIKGAAGNPIERLFWGRTPVERASSMLLYQPGFEAGSLLHAIKYRGRSGLAVTLGRMLAQEHTAYGFFEGIDAIVPVPLHPKRQRQRGYNQSERLARGVSEVTGLPIIEAVQRTKDNVSQTSLDTSQRADNVKGIFRLRPEAETDVRGKHILIIDDVITTGATTYNCALALDGICERLSFLSLAFAGQMHAGRLTLEELRREDLTVSNAHFLEIQHQSLS